MGIKQHDGEDHRNKQLNHTTMAFKTDNTLMAVVNYDGDDDDDDDVIEMSVESIDYKLIYSGSKFFRSTREEVDVLLIRRRTEI